MTLRFLIWWITCRVQEVSNVKTKIFLLPATEGEIMVGTWFGEFYSCCCLPLLPQIACSILPTTYKPLFPSLYIKLLVSARTPMNNRCTFNFSISKVDKYITTCTLWLFSLCPHAFCALFWDSPTHENRHTFLGGGGGGAYCLIHHFRGGAYSKKRKGRCSVHARTVTETKRLRHDNDLRCSGGAVSGEPTNHWHVRPASRTSKIIFSHRFNLKQFSKWLHRVTKVTPSRQARLD